jgi:hypothetical protein
MRSITYSHDVHFLLLSEIRVVTPLSRLEIVLRKFGHTKTISCEKSRFYAKNHIFRRVRPPGSAPALDCYVGQYMQSLKIMKTSVAFVVFHEFVELYSQNLGNICGCKVIFIFLSMLLSAFLYLLLPGLRLLVTVLVCPNFLSVISKRDKGVTT